MIIIGLRNCAIGWSAVIVSVLSLFLVSAIQASQNPNRSLVNSGGTVAAQSSTHRVSGSIGQVASARAQSATNSLAGGFWNTLGTCRCPYIGDLDTNGIIDIFDVVAMVNVAFRNETIPPSDPLCPLVTRADLNCDTIVDILDIVVIVNTAFRNDDERCDPCLP